MMAILLPVRKPLPNGRGSDKYRDVNQSRDRKGAVADKSLIPPSVTHLCHNLV